MKRDCLFGLNAVAAMLAVVLNLSAAKPEDFGPKEIQGIWHEVWKSDDPKVTEPKVEKLTEKDAVERLAGRWAVMFGVGAEKILVSLRTNRLAEVSGKSDGVAWKKSGQWRVVSDKLVLFLKEDDVPSFIFVSGKQTFIFDPWAKTMMSELKREK
jgi:hypothetical protein